MNQINDNSDSSLFQVNQRIRILPADGWPANKKSVRYGVIKHATNIYGMHLVGENRTNNQGEWAYLVSPANAPDAGAMWFSANGIQPVRPRKTLK